MKKKLLYILGFLVIAAAVTLIIVDRNKPKKLDERMSFRKEDKIPYGMYVAYNNLNYLFPDADIFSNRKEPGYWDQLYTYESNQALIIVSPQFFADEFEMKKLLTFIENGNYVFISARNISEAAENFLHCSTNSINSIEFLKEEKKVPDSLAVQLKQPPFQVDEVFSYPGNPYYAWFSQNDSTTTDILGNSEDEKINFIHLRAGKGHLYMQLAPMSFSNYFLLHKNNILYYENTLSVIPPDIKKIAWDEYYVRKRWFSDNESGNNWLSVLFRYPPLKAALITAIITLLAYIMIEMRRKQRYIPVIAKPRNDSLDFVKTIGRLYFDKGDHLNLCRKMAAYFLEHIRNVYKLPTNNLNDEFIKALQFKTGKSEAEISDIITSIKKLDETQTINDKQLTIFHKQLESFYKTA